MAQVIVTDQQAVAESWSMWGRTIILGVLAGILFWLVTTLIGHYIVEPIVCRQLVDANACLNATPLAGTISTVLVAVAAIFILVRIGAARPIIIAAASAALLWQMAAWTEGLFWLEAVAWSALVYALTFALFGWITRHRNLWVAVIISLVIVIALRVALILS